MVGETTERIVLGVELKGEEKLKLLESLVRSLNTELNKSMVAVKQNVQNAGNAIVRSTTDLSTHVRKNFRKITDGIDAIDVNFRVLGETTKILGETVFDRMGNWFRKYQKDSKRFNMNLLSTLFFGMMVFNMFKQMANPAMESFGIFDLWGSMLEVLFLPLIQAIYPALLSFIEAIMNLPEWARLAISGFLAFIGLLGGLLFLLSAVGLGITGLLKLEQLPKLFDSLGNLFRGIGNFKMPKDWSSFITSMDTLAANPIIKGGLIIASFYFAWKFAEDMQDTFSGDSLTIIDRLRLALNAALGAGAIAVVMTSSVVTGAIAFSVTAGIVLGIVDIAWTLKVDGQTIMQRCINALIWGVGGAIAGFLLVAGGIIGGVTFGEAVLIGAAIGVGIALIVNAIDWIIESKLISNMWASLKKKLGLGSSDVDVNIARNAGNNFQDYVPLPVDTSKGQSVDNSRAANNWNDVMKVEDFIWRPGQAPIAISPQDTIVGAKKGIGDSSSSGQTVINSTYNVMVMDKRELEKMFADHDKRLFEDMKRMAKVAA